ncbi:glycosyltransferase family 25 protein [Herbaspirillum lusitanum]|uniref:glycosyltransferase family 25 protein n=1 Tax=Herbaspirillum lusitanum TaxID=213312 RepID=UPI000360F724|nr:glycosyltransferase family 25 protein [Herbaspirillum lusitanum]
MNRIRIINLDDAVARRSIFAEQNQHLDYEFVNAIRGASVDAQVLSDPNLFGTGLQYTKGAYGCALSHLTAWFDAIDSNEVITIAEDDAIFRYDFQLMHQHLLNNLPQDWDIVMWGWNFDSILSLNAMPDVSSTVLFFDQNQLRNKTYEFQLSKQAPVLLPLDKCFGTPAYSISPKGAEKFVKGCFPLEHFHLYFPGINRELPNNGIDIAMNRIYASTNSYACFPPLVVTKNEHEISSVQTNR